MNVLMDRTETLDFILARLARRDYWLFVGLADGSNDFCARLERGYYDGRGEDFDALAVTDPPPIYFGAIYLARKAHLSPERLCAEMRDPAVTPEMLARRDMLAFSPAGGAFLVVLGRLLGARKAEKELVPDPSAN